MRSQRQNFRRPPGLLYQSDFLNTGQKQLVSHWLRTIRPLWEYRFSQVRPLPEGETQRRLLRPVYWLGNWQFACLGYYHPPRGTLHRCVRAEPFPPVLQEMVRRIEKQVRREFHGADLPRDWRLNTCLVNLYGSRLQDGKWDDVARVGEHKDFEPGPVASVSLGERALFQFVQSHSRHARNQVVYQQWLEDGSLQIFGGDVCKNRLFHRVQRVEKKHGFAFPPAVADYETRRVNFTFRYVPEAHISRYAELPKAAREDVTPYVEELAQSSEFFRRETVKNSP